jgi:glycosyltransferase involved in cell wall biosynthesis
MKVAIIVPWMYAISGNITAIDLAVQLSEMGLNVDFVVLEAYSGIVDELKSSLVGPNLILFNQLETNKHGKFQYFINQILRDLANETWTSLMDESIDIDYDIILLISDEALALGKHIKKLKWRKKPIVCYSAMELVDHNFFANHGRFKYLRRFLFFPFYLMLQKRYEHYLKFYDLLFANSKWTDIMVNYFYDIKPVGVIQSVSLDFFISEIGQNDTEPSYLAVPTSSLGKTELNIISKLREDRINMIFYGQKELSLPNDLGFLPKNEMIKVVANARAMLFLFDYEALGLIPIESLALGTPVITYERAGPSLSINESKFVTYVRNYADIKRACELALSTKLTSSERIACRKSVETYMPEVNAKNFIRSVVEHKRDAN